MSLIVCRVKYHNLETGVIPCYTQGNNGCVFKGKLGQLFIYTFIDSHLIWNGGEE